MLSDKASGSVAEWLGKGGKTREEKRASIDHCLVPSIHVDKCLK